MSEKLSNIELLENKIITLINKLKENYLQIKTLMQEFEISSLNNNKLNKEVESLREENKSLKIANNLLGSKEGNTITKTKIKNLIKEVDYCISQVTEIN
jgi:cobalamin biosynthesis Co2+ chelatase CbiK